MAIEAAYTGLLQVLTWSSFSYLLYGVGLGMFIGAIPGLGGVVGLIILLPFTYEMEPVHAFALLIGLYAVTSTSDTIASVMLGVPGTAASQATILDGFPLAKKGQAQRAFGAAFTVSAIGGLFGAVVLVASLPLALPIIVAFGSPELFMLGILALTMVGALSGKSLTKGLAVACFGLFLSTIGYDDSSGIPRFYLGSIYLIDGLPIIPVILGLFAIPELVTLAVKNTQIADQSENEKEASSIWDGIRDVYHHRWLTLRCATIGTYVGMLPGLGAAIVDWLAYGHAFQSAKDNSRFGSGDIRGVIAPETANNASKGGALLPTIVFGIPGNLGTSILLSVLLIVGLRPGPDLLTTDLDITFSIIWTLAIANVLAGSLLLIWSKQVAKLATISGHLIVPAGLLFVFMGAWLASGSLEDWFCLLAFGILGYVMKILGWPRPPLILAYILGGLLEPRLYINMQAYDGFTWLVRPIVLIIIAVICFTLFVSIRRDKRRQLKTLETDSQPGTADFETGTANISQLIFAFFLCLIFSGIVFSCLEYPKSVSLFPGITATAGLILSTIAASNILRSLKANKQNYMTKAEFLSLPMPREELMSSLLFFAFISSIVLITLLVGQKASILFFVATYLFFWGKISFKITLGYSFACWLILYFFYGHTLNIIWHTPYLN